MAWRGWLSCTAITPEEAGYPDEGGICAWGATLSKEHHLPSSVRGKSCEYLARSREDQMIYVVADDVESLAMRATLRAPVIGGVPIEG